VIVDPATILSSVRPYKACYGSPASFGVICDFPFSKSPNRPALRASHFVESAISFSNIWLLTMPIIPIGLDDETSALEDKIGPPPAKHSLMHFEFKMPFSELLTQGFFDMGHLCRGMSLEPVLAKLFTNIGSLKGRFPRLSECWIKPLFSYLFGAGNSSFWMGLPPRFLKCPHFLEGSWLCLITKSRLTQRLSMFGMAGLPISLHRIAHLKASLRRYNFSFLCHASSINQVGLHV